MRHSSLLSCSSIFPKRLFSLLSLVLAGGLGVAQAQTSGNHALSSGSHVNGDEVDLVVPCAEVKLDVDSALKSGLTMVESHGSAVQIQNTPDGAGTLLGLSLKCVTGSHLTLKVAPSTMLTLHDSPNAHILVRGTLAGLDASLTDASLTIAQVPSLSLALHGTATAQIARLDRAAQIIMDGSSRASVGQVQVAALSAQMKDTSALTISSGEIETLSLTVTNHATASILATSGSAQVTASEQADVLLGPVTGTLKSIGTVHRRTTNLPAGTDTVSAQTPPPLPTTAAPAALPQTDTAAQGLPTAGISAAQHSSTHASLPSATPAPLSVPPPGTATATVPQNTLPSSATVSPTPAAKQPSQPETGSTVRSAQEKK